MFPYLLLNFYQEILKLFLVVDRVELWRTKFRWRRWNCKAQTFNSGFWPSEIWKSKFNCKANSEPAKLELTVVGLPKRTSMMSGCRSESLFWYFFLAFQFEEISFVYAASRIWLVRIKRGLRKFSRSFSYSKQLKWQLIEALTNAVFIQIQRKFSWYRSLMTSKMVNFNFKCLVNYQENSTQHINKLDSKRILWPLESFAPRTRTNQMLN
jgi:hypothetical protein